jgi:predicted metal-dependent hydrolase
LNNQAQKVNLEDEVLLFGEVISIDSEPTLFLQKKLLKLKSSDEGSVLQAYDSFYKHVAKIYLPQRVAYYSSLMHLSFEELKYRKMRRRWGSCSATKVITFNTQLIKVQKELIDYVIVHELAHLKHMNHSKEFHALVEQYLPNSKHSRKSLKNIQLT